MSRKNRKAEQKKRLNAEKQRKKPALQKTYPFVNPIIVTLDNKIIDGQYRFEVCKQMNSSISIIKVPHHSDNLTDDFFQDLQRIQEEQRLTLEKWFIENDISFEDQLMQSSSVDKMKKFIEFKDRFVTDKSYWEQLADCYLHNNNNYRLLPEIKQLFLAEKSGRENLMSEDDRDFLKKLPDEIKIYRGMTVEEFQGANYGISWTLNMSIAKFYADTFIHNYETRGKDSIVKELTVKKEDIIAYFSGRKEEEIIYIHNTLES